MYRRILLAVELPDLNDNILNKGLELARAADAQLMILHVLSGEEANAPAISNPISSIGFYHPNINERFAAANQMRWGKFRQLCLEQLQWHVARAEAQGVEASYTLLMGNPGRSICEFAREWEPDLIIMGRHGKVGLEELVLGSVSNYVTHNAPCAVMLLSPPNTQQIETAEMISTASA